MNKVADLKKALSAKTKLSDNQQTLLDEAKKVSGNMSITNFSNRLEDKKLKATLSRLAK